MEYCRLIVLNGDNGNCQGLTPIEKAAYEFADMFYELDGDGAIVDFKNRVQWVITQQEYMMFRMKLVEIGVSEKEFLGVYRHDLNEFGGLSGSFRPFSWRLIKQWNDFKALGSVISVEGIEEYDYRY